MDHLLRGAAHAAAFFGVAVDGELVGDYSPLAEVRSGQTTLEELKVSVLPVISALTGRPLLAAQLIVYPPVPDFAPESRASIAAVTAQPRLRAGHPVTLPPPGADGRERPAFFVVSVVLAPAATSSPGPLATAPEAAVTPTKAAPALLEDDAAAAEPPQEGAPQDEAPQEQTRPVADAAVEEPPPQEVDEAAPPPPSTIDDAEVPSAAAPPPAQVPRPPRAMPTYECECGSKSLRNAPPRSIVKGLGHLLTVSSSPSAAPLARSPSPAVVDDATLDEAAARLLPTVTMLPPGYGGVQPSPTLAEAGVGTLFGSALAALVASPVTLPQPPSMAAAAAAWLSDAGTGDATAQACFPSWLHPSSSSPPPPPHLATRFLPAWTALLPQVAPGDDVVPDALAAGAASAPHRATATAVAAAATASPLRVRLPWFETAPSRVTMAATGHPGFAIGYAPALASSSSSPPWPLLEVAVMHAAMDVLHSLFSDGSSSGGSSGPTAGVGGGGGGSCRFYATPPVAYALAAASGHVGHTLCVELLGGLHVAPASEPFFLGSPYHEAAVAALRDAHFPAAAVGAGGDCVDLDGVRARWAVSRAGATAWTPDGVDAGDGSRAFYRVLWWDAFPPGTRHARFRALHEAYDAYTAAIAAAAAGSAGSMPLPPALLPARLRYGAFAVLVATPHVAGRDACADDLADAAVASQLGAGVAWLARHGLVLGALGPAAVMVADVDGAAGAVVTDYDSLAVLPAPVATPDELRAAYATVPWWAEHPHVADAAVAALGAAGAHA
jgi:hypothetical protein